jgi:hypothetical protein
MPKLKNYNQKPDVDYVLFRWIKDKWKTGIEKIMP